MDVLGPTNDAAAPCARDIMPTGVRRSRSLGLSELRRATAADQWCCRRFSIFARPPPGGLAHVRADDLEAFPSGLGHTASGTTYLPTRTTVQKNGANCTV